MAFNTNSITPYKNFVNSVVRTYGNKLQSATFWARWGAAQAAEALKYQMPTDGIRDRPPTEEDGDQKGWVQVLSGGYWATAHWTFVASNHAGALTNGEDGPIKFPWLHTPTWLLTPKLKPKEQALALLKSVRDQFTDQEFALLCQVMEPAPVKTTPATPLTIAGHVVKPGDCLFLRNTKAILAHTISRVDDLWQVSYKETSVERSISVYADGKCPFDKKHDIVAVTPNCAASRLT